VSEPSSSSAERGRRGGFLYLTTIGRKSGEPHEIEIWYAELRGRHYLIAELGERSHWVRNLRREPRVSIAVGDRSWRASARVLDEAGDAGLLREVRALFDRSYGWSDGLVVELVPEPRP
jgi:deazaflavin-dependent oxidoreductase (nitroreductase family)